MNVKYTPSNCVIVEWIRKHFELENGEGVESKCTEVLNSNLGILFIGQKSSFFKKIVYYHKLSMNFKW